MRRLRLVGVRPGLLQTFRLTHALAESGVPVDVPRSGIAAWEWLDRYFDGLDWDTSLVARRFSAVTVDHERPLTRVGGVERPLLFPHGAMGLCRQAWAEERDHRMTFAGLMTDQRTATLAPLTAALGDEFQVVSTDAGRRWPTKAWDADYYSVLGRSELVACPNGDYVWTYRFFEAAMCGAIPVVEDVSVHYDGFRYYRMSDPAEMWQWREDWAEHNGSLVRERLTVPHAELRAAVLE